MKKLIFISLLIGIAFLNLNPLYRLLYQNIEFRTCDKKH